MSPRAKRVADLTLVAPSQDAAAELTSELLRHPAKRAVRVIAMARLEAVTATYERLVSGDREGLHDLRVALRRLRSWLRAFRSELDDTVRKKTVRRLRALADATNVARDAEVALEWISAQTDLARRARPGSRYMVERLEREHEAATQAARKSLDKHLPTTLASLSDQLGVYWLRQSVDDPEVVADMSEALRTALREHADRLARTLEALDSPIHAKRVHRARIVAKRLRYLLETLSQRHGAAVSVARLAALQEVLGVVHDAHRAGGWLVREMGECAARDARQAALRVMDVADEDDDTPPFAKLRPGLMALAARARALERKTYVAFRRRWHAAQIDQVRDEVVAVAKAVARRARPETA